MTNGKNKDIYPQIYRMRVTQSAANTWTTAEFHTSIQNAPTDSGKVRVWSIQSVTFYMEGGAMNNGAMVAGFLLDRAPAAVPADNDPAVLAKSNHTSYVEAAQGAHSLMLAQQFQMHGVLYAKSRIYIGAYAASQSTARVISIHIIFRWVDIDPTEFIGIVTDN